MFTVFDKAIAAFITPVIMSGLLAVGITGEMTVSMAVNILITGLFTAASVYLTKNKVK